ncbi:MAG: hypothetical protein FJX46_05005 [Alphaproteobacteria bacterium]|nr:hypothetical protein [Alphaproteobacteria bacterium]
MEALLSLDGARFDAASGYVVEFKVKRAVVFPGRPHGIKYSLVMREADGDVLVRFDNAHAPDGAKRGKRGLAFDHWHRTATDPGRPYKYQDRDRFAWNRRRYSMQTVNRGPERDARA